MYTNLKGFEYFPHPLYVSALGELHPSPESEGFTSRDSFLTQKQQANMFIWKNQAGLRVESSFIFTITLYTDKEELSSAQTRIQFSLVYLQTMVALL